MDYPKECIDPNTRLEQAVRNAGFASFFKARKNCFAEILGAAVLHHLTDSSQQMPENLSQWARYLSPFMASLGGYRVQRDREMWVRLKRTVLEFLREKLSTETTNPALNGTVPDRANEDAFKSIASALRVAIIWSEDIEGEIVTRYFSNSQPGICVFYLYLASDKENVYALLHESMRSHNPEQPVPSCSDSQSLRPIILGRLWQDAQPEEAPRLLLRLLLDVVAATDPSQVPRSVRVELGQFVAAWDTVQNQLRGSPMANFVDLEQLRQAMARVAEVAEVQEPPSPPVANSPHPLVTCEQYPDYQSPFVQHGAGRHKYHEQCLREYFIRLIHGRPEGTVYTCPKCIIPFDEALVQRLLPDLRTIKSNAIRAWQEQSTQQIR